MKPWGTVLIGAGVVGRAILRAHVDANVSVGLIDQDPIVLADAINALHLSNEWSIGELETIDHGLTSVRLNHESESTPQSTIVIESIAERLDVKQQFFSKAETLFGATAILCSNTSTLRISSIASSLTSPQRFAGMHFFMPVDQRPAVELVRGHVTSSQTIQACVEHAHRIGKVPVVVADTPGFIVNRLLSPYLNQAMLLLCAGVDAERIEHAAVEFGMPMSPLELIDLIGTRTTFDAGRVYWQSFPHRIDPAPLLGKMIKQKRLGKSVNTGFYDYVDDRRSPALSPDVVMLANSYLRPIDGLSNRDLRDLLSIPMLIEAAILHRDSAVQSIDHFDLAMRGGLGYSPNHSWLEFYQDIGSRLVLSAIERWESRFKSMRTTPEIISVMQRLLSSDKPSRNLLRRKVR